MKIVQVASGFPPEQIGGVEWYTFHLAQTLSVRGHAIWVFSRTVNWRMPEWALIEQWVEGLRVFRINNTWRVAPSFEETYHHRALARRFGELLDWLRPDVVHIQHLVHLSTHLPDEAQKRGIPVVMTFHDYWPLCNQGQLLRVDGSICTQAITGTCTDCVAYWLGMGTWTRRVLDRLERWCPLVRYLTWHIRSLARRWLHSVQRRPSQQARLVERMRLRREEMRRLGATVDTGIVPSRMLFGQLVAFGLPPERLIHRPYTIPTQLLVRAKRKPGRVFRVTYIGRIIPAKGIHVLLEAAEQLSQKAIQIDIYGHVPPYKDLDYARRIRRRARRLPSVRWHGSYDHRLVGRVLADADVIVVPSIWYEVRPLVILEAFAARTPVVATDLGNIRELVRHEENGLLFPRGDAQALAECLARLADDRALLERLQEGIGPVKDINVHVCELESIYEQLLSHRAVRVDVR